MRNVAEWLAQHAARTPGKRCTVCGSAVVSYAQAAARVAALANGVRSLGAGAGERVVLIGANTPAFLEALLAVLASGAAAVPLNTRWSSQEVRAALALVEPRLVIVDSALRHLVPQGVDVLVLGRGEQQQEDAVKSTYELTAARLGAPFEASPPADGLALIVFTSGTTGAAKGVCLTHEALAFQAAAKLREHGYCAADTYLHTAPLYHVGGLVSWLAMLQAGASHVLMPRYAPAELLRLVSAHGVSAMIAVPAVLSDLLDAAAGKTFPSMRRLLIGAGALHARLHDPLRRLFPAAHCWLAYGMTECASSLTSCPLAETAERSAAGGSLVGAPGPGVQLSIRAAPGEGAAGSGGAQPLPPGSVGEVWVRGPLLMCGYWRDAAATAAALTPDGWLRTGDLGHTDARGRLWLVGRLKDVVRSGGENVAAAEVEQVLMDHPGVRAAAVVGLPHPRLGEEVAALVQLATGAHVTAAELQAFCRKQGLARFKVPRQVGLTAQPLPANSSGKVLKQQAKAQLLRLLQAPRSRL